MQILKDTGYYGVHYKLMNAKEKTLAELKQRLLNDPVRYTGWGPFWFPTKPEIAPQVIDQMTYECTHDGTGPTGQIERWRATTDGEFTIIRAHDLDRELGEPGTKLISLILPIWRVAELMLHASRMGKFFEADHLEFTVMFTGLRGRKLTTHGSGPRVPLSIDYTTQAASFEQSLTMQTEDIDRHVVDFTYELLKPFYALFEFDLSVSLCEKEITRMRNIHF